MSSKKVIILGMADFGYRIKERLKIEGLSQKDLSELLDVHIKTIQKWIKGDVEPGLLKAYKMCHFLNCDLFWLITGHVHPAFNKSIVSDTGKFLVREAAQQYNVPLNKEDAELIDKLKTLKPEQLKTIKELINLYAGSK